MLIFMVFVQEDTIVRREQVHQMLVLLDIILTVKVASHQATAKSANQATIAAQLASQSQQESVQLVTTVLLGQLHLLRTSVKKVIIVQKVQKLKYLVRPVHTKIQLARVHARLAHLVITASKVLQAKLYVPLGHIVHLELNIQLRMNVILDTLMMKLEEHLPLIVINAQ